MLSLRRVALLAVLVTLGSVLAVENEVRACSPVREPGTARGEESGLLGVTPMLPGTLSRDGGILFSISGSSVADVLARAEVTVTDGAVTVAGNLRDVSAVDVFKGSKPAIQFVPASGLLPLTSALSIRVAFRESSTSEPITKTFRAAVDDTRLVDLAMPDARLEVGRVMTDQDPTSPKVTCMLSTPFVSARNSCGTGGETVTETTFYARLRRTQFATLHIAPRYDYGVSAYVAYETRVTWPGSGAGGSNGAPVRDGYGFLVPVEAKGEVCYEIVASSSLLDGFPKVTKACAVLLEHSPVTDEENAAHVKKKSEPCASVSADGDVPGITDGCIASGRRARPSGGVLGLGAAACALLALRRRRHGHC